MFHVKFSEKIDKLLRINENKIDSIGDLERFIGVGLHTIRKAYNENREPSEKIIKKLIRSFSLSQEWWESGKGDIFDENPTSVNESESVYKKKERQIPFYEALAVGGSAMLADQSPITDPVGFLDPGDFFPKATGIMAVYGHSGFPKYPAGCKVAFKDADKDLIFWGEDYVIETSERRIIKRLEKHEDRAFVKAVSYNKSDTYAYADMEIPIVKIKRLYMVLGKVELEASI